MTYNIDELDSATFGRKPSPLDVSRPPTSPLSPFENRSGSKFDIGSLEQEAGLGRATGLSILASTFGNRDRDIKADSLRADLRRYFGGDAPVVNRFTLDDAQRRLDQAQMDHALRDAPRTTRLFEQSVATGGSTYWAKDLADIERAWAANSKKAAEAGIWRDAPYRGLADILKRIDAIPSPLGFAAEMSSVGKIRDIFAEGGTPAVGRVIEGAPRNIAAGVYGDLIGGTMQVGGALWDIIGKTLEPIFGDLGPSELTKLSGAIRKFADSVAYKPPEGIGPVEQGAHSGMRSLGSMLLPTAAGAAQALTAPKMAAGVASAWMAGSVGGTTYGENLEKTGDVYRAALHGIADAGWEYIFERLGGNAVLFDKAAWAKGFFGGVAKFAAREVPSEMATTFAQKVDEWVYKTPERTISEFIDELPDDMIETVVATLVGGGGQIALAKGVEAVARIGNVQSRAEDEAAVLARLFPLAAQSDAFRADPQTFQQFFQEATDGATVLVDRVKLEEAMLTGSIDPGVLPSLQGQENIPGEVEIPVAELVTAFAGTPAEAAIIQHVRPDPEAPTLAEAREEGNKAMEVLREVGAAAMERHAQNKAFSDQMAAIKEEIVADLNNRAAFGPHASAQYAELVGHFYATLADKLGVTPIQVRDGWYDNQGRERRGYRLRISADQTREKIAATPEDFAPGRVANVLNRGGWAIITAENPGGKTAAPEENAAQQALLKAELDKAGYTYEQIEGKYAPDGEEQTTPLEHPFLVYGVDTARALELGRLFGQDSVLTKEGLVYHDGTVEPAKRVIEHKTEPANYWSRVPSTGAMFTADIDSGNRVPLGAFYQAPAGPRARANTFSVLRGVNTIASAEQLALSKTWGTGRELKLALDARVRGVLKGRGIDPSKWTQDSEEYLVHMLVSEASAALDKDTRAVGWYDDRVTRALSILSLIHPELATDENAKFAFIWALAVTSNGLRVNQNFQLAEQAYAAYKASAENEVDRRMPTDIGVGTTAEKINEGLQAFNDTISALGYDGAREFMLREMTVRDLLAETGKKVSGEGMDTVVLGASILGPKIGNGFFANLYGNFDQLTMDRWFVRTWGRWTGGLVRPKPKEYLAERAAELRGLIGMLTPAERKELQAKWGVKLRVTDLLGLAQELSRATTDRDTREQVAQVAPRDPAVFLDLLGKPKAGTTRFSVGDEIRKLTNKISRGVDGQVESPGNSTNRNFMRAVYTRGLSILQEEYPGLTMSDLQAVMWYPEKLLYDTAGLSTDAKKEYEDEEVPDYANAASNLAKERGIAVPPELETDQRPAVVRRGKSATGAFQQGAGPEQKGYPPGLTLQAVHFSTAEREALDPASYGRGIMGAERARVMAAEDSRIKQRTHFYASTGQGVFPEQGVGAHAHVVTLHNLYDADVDPLGLFRGKSDADMNAAESGVLDAGYDGYVTRTFGRQAAVVYFKASNPDKVEFQSTPSTPAVPAPVYSSTQEARRTIINSKSLPMGQLPVDKWRRYIAAAHPELMAILNRDGVFERAEALGRLLYRDEIARLLTPPPGEFYQNLEGLPSKVDVDGKTVEFGEFPAAKAAAEAYMAKAGLPYNPPRVYVPVDVERAKRIAQAFEEMKNDPNDPEVAAAYAALAREVTEQYRAVMAAGLKVEFIPSGQPDPYGNPRNAILDIVNNNHMWVYSTRDGFGQGEVEDSPMLAETEFQISGQTALVNDLFRVVHDYFGHAMNGVGFRAAGEENAWREHWSMLSPLARKALTTETRGQNSWLNYGPHGEKNRTAKTEDTVFAPQKVGLLPDWVVNDGATDASTGFAQTSWYSPLARAFEQAKQGAMPGAQWKAWLFANASKLGVKADEIQWSGINEYLDLLGKDKVTKQEIADYLSGNGVRVEDVVKGGSNMVTERDLDDAEVEARRTGNWDAYEALVRRREDEQLGNDANGSGNQTEFASYWDDSYPGGIPRTYHEILVTLPEKIDALPSGWRITDQGPTVGNTRYAVANPDGVTVAYAPTEAEAVNRANRFGKVHDGRSATSFRSPHWDEPNVLVHLRLDEVTGADGKRYVRVGEIQSDWGQKGKKEGFLNKPRDAYKVEKRGHTFHVVDDAGTSIYEAGNEGQIQAWVAGNAGPTQSGHPSGPFVTDTKAWVSLGIKRAIMHAVDVGAEGVVFGTGQQNADLYDLSKQVDNVTLQRMSRDEYLLLATGLDGDTVLEKRLSRPEDAEEHVGKEVTERLIRDMGDDYRGEARGSDLKVGGEGMKAFYDKIVPQVANDVLKKLDGGKVGVIGVTRPEAGWVVRLADGTLAAWPDGQVRVYNQKRDAENSAPAQSNRGAKVERHADPQPGFQITPVMREKAAAGMPLFQGQRQPEQRGSFSPANLEISLLAKADLSTFLHETGHFFLTVYGDLAADLERRALAGEELTAGEQSIVDDMNAMLQQFGFTGEGALGGETLGQGVLLAPNGKRSKLTPEQWRQVRTPEFKEWFGDWEAWAARGGVWEDANGEVSKAVDPDTGEPMVFYHGSTSAGFTEFNTEHLSRGRKGTFFSTSKKTALSYSGRRADDITERPVREEDEDYDVFDGKPGVYAVFLNLRDPTEEYFEGANWDGSREGQFVALDQDGEQLYTEDGTGFFTSLDEAESLAGEDGTVEPAPPHYTTTDGVARTAGNAGALIYEVVDSGSLGDAWDPSTVAIVMRDTDIKSAWGNSGAFDPNNPDIFMQGVDLGPRVKNPGGAKLRALVDRAAGKSLRGILDVEGNLYVWDAYLATHQRGAAEFGVPYDYLKRVHIVAEEDGVRMDADAGLSEVLREKYRADPMVYFSVSGHGIISGPEFADTDGVLLQGQETTPADQPPAGVTPIQAWAAASVNQQRLVHEKFAESFEQYLFTGKAPTPGLKALFRTFTKWLSRVYGTVRQFLARNKNAQLNEELAEVMDRMLATEEAIKRAEEHMGYVQALKDAKQANMTPQQFAAYLALPEEARNEALEALRARSLRDIKWLRNRHNKIIAALQREAKEVRKALRDDISDEVKAEPIYRAAEWLKTGHMVTDDGEEVQATAGFKLSVPALEDMFPEGLGDSVPWRNLGTGRYGMLAAEGLHPDVVAEMFGFSSGRGLVDALLKMTPLGEEIEARTDKAMLEQHGDLTDPTAMAKAADEAVHNAARTRMVATELSALNSLLGSPSSLTRAARNYAEEVVKDTKLRALKAWRYAADEARAGKAALKALGKGDTQAAAEAKRQELLNHATVRAMHEAEKRVKAHLDFLRKVGRYSDNDGPVKSRDGDVVAAIRAVLADHGLATPVKGESSRGYLSTLRDHNPAAADIMEEILDELSSGKEWRDMTVREIDELHQALEGMWSIALRSRQMEIDGKLIGIGEAAQAMRERLDELGVPLTRPGQKKAITDQERRAMKFASLRAAFTRVEFWVNTKDGGAMGPFFRYLFSPVKEAANRYRAEKTEAIKAYRALLQPMAPRLKPMKIDARELGYVFGAGTGGNGRAELLHAMLHTGNGSNKSKLLLGRGWGSRNLDDSLDTRKWDAFLARMHAEGVLTKQDWDFVQGVWDLMESLKPGAQKAHRAIFGRYFAEITAEPVLTPFGTYAGGYVPAITDKDIVDDADVRDLEALEQQGLQFSFPAPARGFTMKRQDAYAKELLLDLNSLTRHIDQVLLFTHLAAPARDAMRLLKSKPVFSALNAQDPKAISKMLIPWLNRAAKQVVENPDPHGWQAWRFWSTARNRAGLTAMFLNVANAAQQTTGFSLAAVKVRPALLAEALAHRIQHPKESGEFVRERSPMMRDRLEKEAAVSGDIIHEVLVNPSLLEKAQSWSNRHAYFLQRAVDSVMSPTIWLAAYNQAQEQGMAETDSSKFADSVVRETQGAQAPEDIAAFEAGTAFSRMFTQFAGYFNMNANLLGSEYRVLARDLGLKAGAGRALYLFLFGFLAPAVVGELIIQAFRGGPGDDDDDGSYLDDWLASLFGWAPLRYLTAMVPFAGQLVNTMANTLNDKPYDDRISTSPAISMLETAAKAPSRVLAAVGDQDKAPRAVADVGVLVGMALGIPVRPVTKAVSYGMQVKEGLVDPTGTPDYLRGIISGTASPASKGE